MWSKFCDAGGWQTTSIRRLSCIASGGRRCNPGHHLVFPPMALSAKWTLGNGRKERWTVLGVKLVGMGWMTCGNRDGFEPPRNSQMSQIWKVRARETLREQTYLREVRKSDTIEDASVGRL